jgi:hypothetical protein
MDIIHPLTLNTKIIAKKQKCSCQGGGFTQISATIKKVINNQSGCWYYLDSGITINSAWVISIIN